MRIHNVIVIYDVYFQEKQDAIRRSGLSRLQ